LSKANFKQKKVLLFLTIGDDKLPIKAIESIKKRIERKGGSLQGEIYFQTHWDPKVNLPIREEEVEEKAIAWLKENNLLTT
jgi:hypothetical protein